MDNENKNVTIDDEITPEQEDQSKETDVTPKEDDPTVKADKIIEKLHIRLDKKSQNEKSLQAQLDKANETIKELRGGKKESKPQVDEKDQKIKDLEAKLARREAMDDANTVLKESGINLDKAMLNMVVSDNSDVTDENIRTLITYTSQVKDAAQAEFLKGKTPRQNGAANNAMSKKEINEIKDPIKRVKAIRDNMGLYQ